MCEEYTTDATRYACGTRHTVSLVRAFNTVRAWLRWTYKSSTSRTAASRTAPWLRPKSRFSITILAALPTISLKDRSGAISRQRSNDTQSASVVVVACYHSSTLPWSRAIGKVSVFFAAMVLLRDFPLSRSRLPAKHRRWTHTETSSRLLFPLLLRPDAIIEYNSSSRSTIPHLLFFTLLHFFLTNTHQWPHSL
jgi:hypothetical protein